MKLTLLMAMAAALASAKVVDKNATIAGMSVYYKVVLPTDYDPEKVYPAVLAFPPGDQSLLMVMTTLNQNWSLEAQKRGYLVIIPSAPNGHRFYEEGSRVFPEFLDKLLGDYKIRDHKFHIAGMSAGGLSAFHLAASYPQYFWSVTGFPGYLPDATPDRLAALAKMCLNMHVGEFDASWREKMEAQAAEFRAKGFAVRLTVEPNQGHVISSLTGSGSARLFQDIEGCKK